MTRDDYVFVEEMFSLPIFVFCCFFIVVESSLLLLVLFSESY